MISNSLTFQQSIEVTHISLSQTTLLHKTLDIEKNLSVSYS